MPDPYGLTKASGIGPDPGSPRLPRSGEDLLNNGTLAEVLQALGLDDPLGVGHGSVLRPAAGVPLGTKMLGEVMEMPKTTTSDGLSLPRRIRVSGYDPQAGTIKYHGANMTGTPMQSSASDFETLHNAGVINRESVPSEGLDIPELIARLLKKLPKSE